MSKLSKRSAGKERESRLLILAVVILFLVLNLLLAYLASHYGWYFLATDRMFYTLSGVTDEYFEKVNPENRRVEFYFCMSREGLTENNSAFSGAVAGAALPTFCKVTVIESSTRTTS